MIHHVSIPACEPQHVAEVLAELLGGKCYPFGPLEGAFIPLQWTQGSVPVQSHMPGHVPVKPLGLGPQTQRLTLFGILTLGAPRRAPAAADCGTARRSRLAERRP